MRRTDELKSVGVTQPRDAECGDNLVNGESLKNEAQSDNRVSETITRRARFGLFLAAEIVCRRTLVVWVILYM